MVRSSAEARLAVKARAHCAYVKIVVCPLNRRKRFICRARALTRLVPFYYEEYFSEAFEKAVHHALKEWPPDIVQAEWIGSVRYLDYASMRSIPTIYSAHNLEHLVVAGPAKGWRRVAALPFSHKMARIEKAWAAKVTAVSAVAPKEADWYRSANPKTYHVPNAVWTDEYAFRLPSTRADGPVAFIGHLGYPPNRAAAKKEGIASMTPTTA